MELISLDVNCSKLFIRNYNSFFINVGMNMQLLPVTGQTLPFMSYGGTHLLTEFAGLGILNGMRKYRRTAHRDVMSDEFIGS